jgi:RNA polymerase sigma factor (TIGR02999 family)
MGEVQGEVTQLLQAVRQRQPDAESRLFELVYVELKRLARKHLRHEQPGHTLGATDLVHEVYLRMAGPGEGWTNRAHFFAAAARAMRRVLVDYARSKRAKKRGGGQICLPFDDAILISGPNYEFLIEVDDALERLSKLDARKARVVELRVFGGLSVEQTAEVLQCCRRTVIFDWRFAQKWLGRELSTSL